MRTNNPSKVLIVFLSLFFVSLPLSGVNAHETEEWKQYQACVEAKGNKELQINSANDDLQQFEGFRRDIEGWLSDNTEDLRDGVLTSLVAAGFTDFGAATAALANSALDTMDGIALLSLFNSANSSISAQNGVISGLYTDPPGTPKKDRTGYDAVYDRYVDAYNNLSASDKAKIRHAKGADGPYPKMDQPSGSTYGLVACARPSNLSPTCYGYYKDADAHKETCTQKHGTSGTTNVEWWSCFDSMCTHRSKHWVQCRATNCTVLFPPPTRTVHQYGVHTYATTTYHDHEVTCQAYYYRGFFGSTVCGDKYFTCEGSCANGHSSSSGSNPPSGGGSNPPSGGGSNPPPTPTYHACGVHETSVSGDHSLQSSCSSTDSNGNYCTVTNFYACDSHTHSYPAPPPTPTPTPPPPPTTVACGARGWTGCTIRSSDGNACLVDPCDSGCGSYYWSCSSGGVSWHKTSRTCTRSGCGDSYTNCSRGNGTCRAPHPKGGTYQWHGN
ncbi:hypothetical protein F4Y19_22180 [Candidatus Poribacteria bacterium]|nr:hypothetical protein [Candidatus Poribacteria bacterium]